jgi:CheY-like chemotaxis protein
VLVVEDDPGVRELAVVTLKDAGYAVFEAPTGDCAIRLLDAHPEIDLIFTDIVMPGIDGYMLADIAKLRRPEIRILYATGYSHHVESKHGVIHGRVLRKPYRQTQLADLIQKTLA